MSAEDFQIMCTAFYAAYEPLIKIWSGSLAGAGILAGVVMSITMFFRRALLGSA